MLILKCMYYWWNMKEDLIVLFIVKRKPKNISYVFDTSWQPLNFESYKSLLNKIDNVFKSFNYANKSHEHVAFKQ